MSNKNSSGFDGVSNKILKKIIPHILGSLTRCINLSIKEEQFPERLKISKITPIYKKGDPQDPGNYRPINQLSSFSKIFEKTALTQIVEHMQRNEILDKNQFGFRNKHSTSHALMLTKAYIQKKLMEKYEVVMIQLDLAKAFDTVKTDGTLQFKVNHFLQNEKITNWLHSYFQNRKQFTSWENNKSEVIDNFEISVVQGSTLGPHMFNLYINDLNGASSLYTICFADDSNFFVIGKNIKEIEQIANGQLEHIKDYFDANQLSTSIPKTKFLHFVPKNKKREKLSIKIGNQELEEVDSLVYLGVHIDRSLNFRQHYNKIYNKIQKGLRGLIMTKHFLTYKAKLSIYHALIHSHLTYCSIVWINQLNKKQRNQLATMQKKAIRAIFCAKYNSHTAKLFQHSGITKVDKIFEKESLELIFKYNDWRLPTAIMEMINEHLHDPKTVTRSIKACVIRLKPELRPGNMIYDIVNSWNRIGASLREEKYFPDFKKRLVEYQNKYLPCEKVSCISCSNSQTKMQKFK